MLAPYGRTPIIGEIWGTKTNRDQLLILGYRKGGFIDYNHMGKPQTFSMNIKEEPLFVYEPVRTAQIPSSDGRTAYFVRFYNQFPPTCSCHGYRFSDWPKTCKHIKKAQNG